MHYISIVIMWFHYLVSDELIIFLKINTKTNPDLEFQVDLTNSSPFSSLFVCKNPGEMSKESLMVDHK